MRGVIKIIVLLVPILLIGGVVVMGISHVRDAANRARCKSNLKQIGLALDNYQSCYNRFPSGTVPNAELPPDRRLSWLTEIYPAFMEGGIATQFDKSKAWDAEENCPVMYKIKEVTEDGQHHRYREDDLYGDLRFFMCPANPSRTASGLPCVTHYVGIAGVGKSAAELPASDRRAGAFGYDRIISLEDMKDGLSFTLMGTEVYDGGPWTAGGRVTVRGLAADQPYLDEGGQFTSFHRHTSVTNFLFADGSVRELSASVSRDVIEALATIAGGEKVGDIDGGQ